MRNRQKRIEESQMRRELPPPGKPVTIVRINQEEE
jgi:hypothetical protein